MAKSSNRSKQEKEKRWIYTFDELEAVEAYLQPKSWDEVKALLGGKGANLFEMTRLGLPVPPGFTVTTEACNAYLAHDRQFPPGLWEQELAALHRSGGKNRQAFRRPGQPPFCFLPFRRQVFHAGHDGHGAQYRPQR